MKLCECGCSTPVKSANARFIRGHNGRKIVPIPDNIYRKTDLEKLLEITDGPLIEDLDYFDVHRSIRSEVYTKHSMITHSCGFFGLLAGNKCPVCHEQI